MPLLLGCVMCRASMPGDGPRSMVQRTQVPAGHCLCDNSQPLRSLTLPSTSKPTTTIDGRGKNPAAHAKRSLSPLRSRRQGTSRQAPLPLPHKQKESAVHPRTFYERQKVWPGYPATAPLALRKRILPDQFGSASMRSRPAGPDPRHVAGDVQRSSPCASRACRTRALLGHKRGVAGAHTRTLPPFMTKESGVRFAAYPRSRRRQTGCHRESDTQSRNIPIPALACPNRDGNPLRPTGTGAARASTSPATCLGSGPAGRKRGGIHAAVSPPMNRGRRGR